jgi:hypothetical protein
MEAFGLRRVAKVGEWGQMIFFAGTVAKAGVRATLLLLWELSPNSQNQW